MDHEKYVLSAEHQETTRVIACIGGQRYALDFLTRVTRLPSTGNRQGNVLRMKSSRRAANRQTMF